MIILVPDSNINSRIDALSQIDNQLLNLTKSLQIMLINKIVAFLHSGFFYNSLEKFLQVNNYNITNKKDLVNTRYNAKT